MDSTLVIKNSHTYCKNLLALETKYYTHAPRGRLVGVNHRAPRPSREDKQSKYNARQFGYIVRRPYVHASGITNLNTNILTKHNHLLEPLTYYHLYITKLLQGITHIIFSDLEVYVGFYD